MYVVQDEEMIIITHAVIWLFTYHAFLLHESNLLESFLCSITGSS